MLILTLVVATGLLHPPADETQQQPAASAPDAGPRRPKQDARIGDLLERAVEIRSIDPLDEEDDFADLMPLKELIGDARLVTLGEQSHGDGAVFYAKARLIKFLHQEMGFDVLAWESGMFDCREVDRALRDPKAKMDGITGMGIFPIWTVSAQVAPTLEYVRSTLTTGKPIETCGFDHQFSAGEHSKWPAATIAFFDTVDPAMLPDDVRESLNSGMQKAFGRMQEHQPMQDDVKAVMHRWERIPELMDKHAEALQKTHGESEFAFMRRCADDAITSCQSMLDFLDGQNAAARKVTDNNTRDRRMGENLIWLVNERYRDRKIIAWMATMHAVHDVQKIGMVGNPDFYKGLLTCGTVAHKAIGDRMYTIGFTAADGKAGNVWTKEGRSLEAPSKGSLEDLCLQTGKPFLFIDFTSLPHDHWLHQPLVSRPLGYAEMTASEGWPKQMDAMFYIRTMFPSTRENALPPYAVLRVDP
jgi:erythromycin esterase